MKGKYITTQLLIACLSKPATLRQDIHTQLAATIAERKKIIAQLQPLFPGKPATIISLPATKAA